MKWTFLTKEVCNPDYGNYDWRNAFAYAGEPGYGSPNVEAAAPGMVVSTALFT